jgi:hypothetical protein
MVLQTLTQCQYFGAYLVTLFFNLCVLLRGFETVDQASPFWAVLFDDKKITECMLFMRHCEVKQQQQQQQQQQPTNQPTKQTNKEIHTNL